MTENTHLETSATRTRRDVGVPSYQKADLERLGRQRPDIFPNAVSEILFCASMLISMLMSEYYVSGFNIILPGVSVDLSIPSDSQTWPASVFSLVTGAFLLPLGRLADIYGGFVVFMGGLGWFFVWSLVAGFSQNYIMLIVMRALQGLGPAAFLPAGIMLLGSIYRPGPRKNLIFGLYGAFAPLGFFFGIIMGGVTGDYLSWRWYFWLGSIVLFAAVLGSVFSIPRGGPEAEGQKPEVEMDYFGLLTAVPALVLIVFALTDGAHAPQGFKTSYVLACLVLGVLLLAAAVFVEGWVSSQPLLPFSLFEPRYMKPLAVALFFAYGSFGIFLFYASFYLKDVMGYSTINTALAFSPMAAGGVIISTVSGFTLHLLPGRVVMIVSGIGYLVSMLLFALVPDGGPYWAWVFPAMIAATVGIDIMYNATSVFITTNIPQKQQGAAGALINSLVFLGISLFLGVADLVAATHEWRGEKESYKAAFWFGTGCAALALVLLCYIDIGRAESQLSIEERQLLESSKPESSEPESSEPEGSASARPDSVNRQ